MRSMPSAIQHRHHLLMAGLFDGTLGAGSEFWYSYRTNIRYRINRTVSSTVQYSYE